MQGSSQTLALERLVVEPSERGGLALADAYWVEIGRRTRGLVRVRQTSTGVELRLAWLTLFRFGAPRTSVSGSLVECSFPIVGGLLAKEKGGALTFVQRATPRPELEVSVVEYVPLFSSTQGRRSVRRFLYRHVQERAHAAISHSYLERIAARSA